MRRTDIALNTFKLHWRGKALTKGTGKSPEIRKAKTL